MLSICGRGAPCACGNGPAIAAAAVAAHFDTIIGTTSQRLVQAAFIARFLLIILHDARLLLNYAVVAILNHDTASGGLLRHSSALSCAQQVRMQADGRLVAAGKLAAPRYTSMAAALSTIIRQVVLVLSILGHLFPCIAFHHHVCWQNCLCIVYLRLENLLIGWR